MLDLLGQRFGRLVVTKRLGARMTSGGFKIFWRCRCDCGDIADVRTGGLTGGYNRSCGCRQGGQLKIEPMTTARCCDVCGLPGELTQGTELGIETWICEVCLNYHVWPVFTPRKACAK